MIIRRTKKNDLNSILDFMGIRAVKKKTWHISSRKYIESYITNRHNFSFICLEKNKIVGMINGELWDDKGFAYLGMIEAKGKNKKEIIDALFNHLVEFCKRKGITLINTYVPINMKKKIKLYRQLGMRKKTLNYYLEKRI